jgi:hypothetical protein
MLWAVLLMLIGTWLLVKSGIQIVMLLVGYHDGEWSWNTALVIWITIGIMYLLIT